MKKTSDMLKRIILITGATIIVALGTGCSSMNTTSGNNSFAFGKLYAMQNALSQAAVNCQDQSTRNTAVSWAATGTQDLTEASVYMDKEGDEYAHTRTLINYLGTVSRRTKDTGKICENIKSAASATRDYMAALGIQSTLVASR